MTSEPQSGPHVDRFYFHDRASAGPPCPIRFTRFSLDAGPACPGRAGDRESGCSDSIRRGSRSAAADGGTNEPRRAPRKRGRRGRTSII
ncbi:hypothetical protein MTO96_001453 [Rhipicephalus appendiculatus]